MAKSKEPIVCSFCGKAQDQVNRLVAGPGIYICDECITVCSSVIDEDEQKQPSANSEHSSPPVINLPKPKAIKDWLDKHIIGQDYAKKVISVAV